MVKNHANITSHSSKGYRTVKNLGGPNANQSNLDGPSSKLAINAGLDVNIKVGRPKKGKKGLSARAKRALSTRPTMHIKDGKLLLTGHVEKTQDFF